MEPLDHTDRFSCGDSHGRGEADEEGEGCGGELHVCGFLVLMLMSGRWVCMCGVERG